MIDPIAGARFANLEPNHNLQVDKIEDNKVLRVVCPFTDPNSGDHFVTNWDFEENSNDDVNCLFCEGVTVGHPGLSGCEDLDGDGS